MIHFGAQLTIKALSEGEVIHKTVIYKTVIYYRHRTISTDESDHKQVQYNVRDTLSTNGTSVGK